MCGIAGLISRKGQSRASEDRIESTIDGMRHRGPDDSGFYQDEEILFTHVRLSVIDLSPAAHQPMIDNSGDYVISYNGEVYNYLDVAAELEINIARLNSSSDTEIVLQAFKSIGVASFEKLNGMFAFSLLDKGANKAYLVRDRFGIKPLHYMVSREGVYFASEIKSIQALCARDLAIEVSTLSEWSYYGSALRTSTFYDGCKKLLPGHYMEIDLETFAIKIEPYWLPEDIRSTTKESTLTRSVAVSNVASLLEKAVVRQLVSDVPVGVFLSGGIDSSAVTAFASKHYSGKLNTFAAYFDFDEGVNELPKAKLVADKFDTEHHEVHVTGYDLIDTLELLVEHHDLPFADAANIPLYMLTKKVRADIKVVLQGDGGDELFAGYRRYQTLSFRPYWSRAAKLARSVHSLLPASNTYYIRQRYLNALGADSDAELMALLLTVEDRTLDPHLIFSENIRKRISTVDPFKAFRECNDRFADKDIVQRMLFTDTQIILPDIFLEKVDRATMANSIEVRVPFLDNELVEYVMALPSSMKISKGVKKGLLKDALKGIVPNEILNGPKTGFSVPYKYWLFGPLKEYFQDNVARLRARRCQILNYGYIDSLMEAHLVGDKDNGFMLWKVLNLMIWLLSRES